MQQCQHWLVPNKRFFTNGRGKYHARLRAPLNIKIIRVIRYGHVSPNPSLFAYGTRPFRIRDSDTRAGSALSRATNRSEADAAPYSGDQPQYSGSNNRAFLQLSGTSIAAPVVSGAVALLLQKNPSLPPALIKAALQYSARQISGANISQQGAGLLNIDGAVALAGVLRRDISTAIAMKRRWKPSRRARCGSRGRACPVDG
ncbi:MAG TPA: S8 family serine peptidase [Blastocatellia bacterium]|nr:S8 family serine peptidase [Blastocatellia bacterium]